MTYVVNRTEAVKSTDSFVLLGTVHSNIVDARNGFPYFVREFSDLHDAFPGKVIVGLDAKDGLVATDGWAEVSDAKVTDLAKRFEADGVSAIVYTDIARDGMMQGVNVQATVAMAEASSIPVIASGGITDIEDIRALLAVSDSGICGAITGRAIYEGTLDVARAQRLCDGADS